MGYDLSIVVPTFNERENIIPIIESVENAIDNMRWEIIFVDDDSPDGTSDFIKEYSKNDDRIRCIRRVNRRGLTSAAIEGILSSNANCVAVMDADLQHDEGLLQSMYQLIVNEEADIVIGSRYMNGGSTGKGLNKYRLFISKVASQLGKLILKVDISDPMSGYFMLKREKFEQHMAKLSGQGFKILLDIMSSVPGSISVRELPYVMRQRNTGDSKLDVMVMSEYYQLLLDKLIGKYIPVRFIMFASVGLLGVFVHMGFLFLMYKVLQQNFIVSQLLATIIAMTSNFYINNQFTYRDMRLTGKYLVYGLLTFYLACSLGAFINVGVSDFMFNNGLNWLVSGVIGAFIGSVWNYAMTSTFTWKKNRHA